MLRAAADRAFALALRRSTLVEVRCRRSPTRSHAGETARGHERFSMERTTPIASRNSRGVALAREIRATRGTHAPTLILLSSSGQSLAAINADTIFAAGLLKPLRLSHLRDQMTFWAFRMSS